MNRFVSLFVGAVCLMGCQAMTVDVKQSNPPSPSKTNSNTSNPNMNSIVIEEDSLIDLLEELKKQVQLGRMINSDFSIGAKQEEITSRYGKADNNSTTRTLYYLKYQIIFYIDDAGKVTRIATTDPNLFQSTKEQIESIFGKSKGEGAAGSIYYSYPFGSYTLIFRWSNVEQKWSEIYME